MKLFILALDGLEYSMVKTLGIENFLQKKCGKMKVPLDKYSGIPMSPEVWGSFLCAEHVRLTFKRQRGRRFLNILNLLKRALPFVSLGLGMKVTKAVTEFPKLDRKTWVDKPNVEEINVPYYSYDNRDFLLGQEFSETKDLELYRKKMEALYYEEIENILERTRKIVKKEISPDIVFAYSHFPDSFHHIWYSDKGRIKEYYFEISDFVDRIKRIIGETHILIISDHGFDFEKNAHSKFGFISSNKEMVLPESIIELGKRIRDFSEKKIDSVVDKSEAEKVFESLKKLGYI